MSSIYAWAPQPCSDPNTQLSWACDVSSRQQSGDRVDKNQSLCDGITYTPICTHLAHATCPMHFLRPTSLTYPSGPEPHRAWYPPSRQLSSQMNVPVHSQKHACSAVQGRSETVGAEVEGSGFYSHPACPVGSVPGPLTSSKSHASNSKLISLSTGGLETSAPF